MILFEQTTYVLGFVLGYTFLELKVEPDVLTTICCRRSQTFLKKFLFSDKNIAKPKIKTCSEDITERRIIQQQSDRKRRRYIMM